MRFFIIVLAFFTLLQSGSFSKEYLEIKSLELQKKKFIEIMLPLIKNSNENIMKERLLIEGIFQRVENLGGIDNLGSLDKEKLESLAAKYKISKIDEKLFLKRIDVVPVSLAVAQAAVESGWGKSRFVQEANNIFGEWTYSGHGLTPLQRDYGKKHQIRIFKTLQSSVNAYMLNLNRHYAYADFRKKREEFRDKGVFFDGLNAIKTMLEYSEQREDYVKLLKRVIKGNNLLKYDEY